MSNIELEEGKEYSLQELSAWFGSTNPKYLHRASVKEKKLEELKLFANYEVVGRKIKIIEVYEPIYSKTSVREKNDEFYKNAIVEVISETPLQLYKTAAGRIVQKHTDELKQMKHNSFKTSYEYTRRNMKSMFITDQTHGKQDEKVWCKRFYGGTVDFEPLTEVQLTKWKEIIDEAFGKRDEHIAELLSSCDQGEAESAQVKEQIYQLNFYSWQEAKDRFHGIFGFEPISVPRWELSAI